MRVHVEGPQIEPLLTQVREEYGSNVRIVSADKVRKGGVAGFFSRQHYEIAIDVADEAAEPGDAAEAGDAFEAGTMATAPSVPGPAPVTDTAGSLLDLVDARQDLFDPSSAGPVERGRGPRPLPARAALVSTAGAAFAEVMAGLRGEGTGSTPATAHGRPAVPTVRPYHPPVVSAAVTTAAEPAPAADPAAEPARAADRAAEPARAADRAAVSGPAAVPVPGRPWLDGLLTLGLPEALARRATGTDAYQAVLTALADTASPPTPPGRPGDVLVVVGEIARALGVAREVAQTLRLDPARVLVAGGPTAHTTIGRSRRISGPTDAERRARRMHRADTPHIVVVDAPVDDTDTDWVRAVCDALGATAVWSVVDATRKTADTARLLRGFGKVDAIAVYAAVACGDPASVLTVGPPVVLLDGQRATADAWAALLSQRLVAAGAAQRSAGAGAAQRGTAAGAAQRGTAAGAAQSGGGYGSR